MFAPVHKPETKVAFLVPSRGPRRATRHVYARTDLVEVGSRVVGYAFIFKCDETGAERRWGLESLGESCEAGVAS